MSYEPKTWECGDVITAEDLNHLEQGVAQASSGGGGGLLLVHVLTDESDESNYLDITPREAIEAVNNGGMIFAVSNYSDNPNRRGFDAMTAITLDQSGSGNRYEIRFGYGGYDHYYVSSSEDNNYWEPGE